MPLSKGEGVWNVSKYLVGHRGSNPLEVIAVLSKKSQEQAYMQKLV
jgi:hypothetical protein